MMLALSETWYMFGLCMAIAIAGWCVFIWAVRSGQFKDTEQTAIDMLELDANEEPILMSPTDQEGNEPDASGTLGGHEVSTRADR